MWLAYALLKTSPFLKRAVEKNESCCENIRGAGWYQADVSEVLPDVIMLKHLLKPC